uniref:Apolipoprotein A-I n=1 Tax=Denticeps clupeoides TaxID=299321 RepID=A0AAY4AL26_9TELE
MKAFLVLAAVVFTGCHANIFYADEPKPQLEQLSDAFWDYVAQATPICNYCKERHQYATTLQNQMSPLAKDVMAKITQEAEVLKDRLAKDLTTSMGPYAESLDSETLKATLLQKSEELKGSLEKSVKELQSQLGPYSDEIKQRLDQHLADFQKSVSPMAEELQIQVAQRTKIIQQSLAPYAEDLRGKLDPYAQDLKTQLTSLYESFSKSS